MSKGVVKRGVALYIDGKEVENSVTSINREIRKLTNEWKKMDENTQEYYEHARKIRTLKSILAEHNQQLKNIDKTQSFTLSKGVDLFNKYAASAMAVIAALTGVMLKLNSMRQLANEREEAKANVQALTGLDDDAISWLEGKAVELSTTMDESGLRIRQSASEILEAYMMVGSNKPELLEVKEDLNAVTVEAMRLAAASGMALPKAVDATTTALNQYGAAASDAAKYVNVLAAGSKYGAANVEQQTAAILKAGTIAASSNVSIEELVGSIEMLGEKGLKNEIAGTGLKKFFTVLSTGASDTNPKVVGLTTAMENLNKKVEAAEAKAKGSGGAKLLKKMFGEEGLNTAMILTQNTEKFKEYTQAVTDTNVATEQAAINSDTAAAKLAQIKNELNETGIELMKELNPAIMKFLSHLTNWSRYSVRLVKFIAEHRAALGMLTAAVILYTTWVNRKVIADKLDVLWNGKVVTSIKAVNAALKANPWLAIASVIVVAVGALIDYNREMTSAVRKQNMLNSINSEASAQASVDIDRMKRLFDIARDETETKERRISAIKQLNELSPEYFGNLSLETINTTNADEAIKKYTKSLIANAKAKVLAEKIAELQEKKNEFKNGDYSSWLDSPYSAWWDSFQTGINSVVMYGEKAYNAVDAFLMNGSTKGWNYKTWIEKEGYAINSLEAASIRYGNKMKQFIEDEKVLQQELNDVTKELLDAEPPTVTGNPNGNGGNGTESDEEKKKRINKEMADIELNFYKQRKKLKEDYIKDATMTEEDFNNLSMDLTYQELNEKLKILGLEPAKRAEIQDKIMDLKIQFEKKFREAEKAEIKSARQERYEELESAYKNELKLAEKYHKKHHTSEEDYTKAQRKITLDYLDKIMTDITLSEEQKFKLKEKFNKISSEQSEDFTDKEIERFNSLKDAIIESMKDLGENLAGFFADEETNFKEFMKNTLIILIDFLEKQLIAEQAAAIANVTIKDVSSKGFLGLAAAAGKIALITAAFETAKTVLGNFYTGGYTGPGDWNEPKGYVHSNEFVANRFAVANPHVRPVLDLIDAAQRSNSIGNLSGEDIASVAGSSPSPKNNPVPTVVQVNSNQDNKELDSTLKELKAVIKLLHGRLDEPFVTINTISGRNGTKAKLDEYERILKNKSRLKP